MFLGTSYEPKRHHPPSPYSSRYSFYYLGDGGGVGMNNQSRDRTGKYGFSGDYGRICKCGHNLGTHTAEPPHICGSNGTGLVDCACMKFVPTPPPEESTLSITSSLPTEPPDAWERDIVRPGDIETEIVICMPSGKGEESLKASVTRFVQLILERERLARIDEVKKVDMTGGNFYKYNRLAELKKENHDS